MISSSVFVFHGAFIVLQSQTHDQLNHPILQNPLKLGEGLFHYWLGRLDLSLDEFQRATNLWSTLGNQDWLALTDWIMGNMYYDRDDHELSRKYFNVAFQKWIANFPANLPMITTTQNFSIELSDLAQGRIDSAKSRLGETSRLVPKIKNAWNRRVAEFYYQFLNAEVLLAEGSVSRAIAVGENLSPVSLGRSWTRGVIPYNMPLQVDILARSYKQNGEIDKAIGEYERLITFDPNSNDRRLIHPKYHYHLAKLYEEKGQSNKAIEQFEKFLGIWKNADSDLPELIDARARLAKLKGVPTK